MKNAAKPTPGPWRIEKVEKQHYCSDTGQPSWVQRYVKIVADKDESYHAGWIGTVHDHPDAAGNAALWAAAPDCLLALQTILKAFAPNGTEGLTVQQSNAIGRAMNAIAKATGEGGAE